MQAATLTSPMVMKKMHRHFSPSLVRIYQMAQAMHSDKTKWNEMKRRQNKPIPTEAGSGQLRTSKQS